MIPGSMASAIMNGIQKYVEWTKSYSLNLRGTDMHEERYNNVITTFIYAVAITCIWKWLNEEAKRFCRIEAGEECI